MKRGLYVIALAALGLLAAAGGAAATFPGQNGQIAFVRTTSSPANGIFVVGPDGQDPHQISPGSGAGDVNPAPSYSADGERITFSFLSAGDDEIYVMNADGTNQVQLTDNAVEDNFSAFSPDGRKIVFTTRVGGGDLEIAVMDADGQNIVPLTDNTVNEDNPSFSPDGSKIVFRRNEPGDSEIYVMDADGGNQTPLTVNAEQDLTPSWSPDGHKIAFGRGSGNPRQIFVMDADGGNQTPLTPAVANTNDIWPSFSPDGEQIVFSRSTPADAELMVMPASGGNATPLFTSPERDLWTNWQPLNRPTCDLSGAAKQKSPKQVTVTVTCPENASVAASGELKASKPKAAISQSKTAALDPVTTPVPAGTPTTITLSVPKKGRKLLKRALKAGKKPKGSVSITATDDLGATATDSFAVKLKRKKQ